MHASPLTFSQCTLSLSGAGSEGWDQMREGVRMEEEEEEERGMRAGCEERRSDSRLLSGVPLTPSPVGGSCFHEVSLQGSGVPSGLSQLLCGSKLPQALSSSSSLFLSVSQSFTPGGLSC
ncbi:unnamed protein product [Pleuronectes platessa]|uniref:Uncharacterized protein n=1 Tax=Pleuronectes platessa TaxID=8262 RepID=A0A9N7Z0A1_PLEPL|nr:unnamed protein product [Pleuronectes platessa]